MRLPEILENTNMWGIQTNSDNGYRLAPGMNSGGEVEKSVVYVLRGSASRFDTRQAAV